MATVNLFSRIVNGVQRQVDVSTNTLAVGSLLVGGLAGTTLTKAILDNLVSLQNGTEVGGSLHTHSTIYYTKAILNGSGSGTAGTTLIGDDASYTHFTPATATLKAALTAIDSALGASTASTAFDGTFVIVNTADNTKKLNFSAAAITSGQTRTITMPDANVNLGLVATAIQANGSVPFTANQSHGGFRITNVADATSAQDAVTLNQLQNQLAGLDWKQHVRAMSDSNITLSGTQTVDGAALIAGDRILVQNQTTASANGIYVVAPGAWSRSSDATTGTQLTAASVYIDEGTNYKGTAWVQTAPAPITVGTTTITFVKFASILPLIFRNGLTQTGQNVDVTPGDTSLTSALNSLVVNVNASGAIVTASGLKINLESSNPTLQIATNQLGVKLDAARAITTGASGIGVNIDTGTMQISANAVGIKPSGVSATQIATGAFDQSTIKGGAGTPAFVASAPAVSFSGLAGQAFSANTTYAVRFGIVSNGETAGRLFAADIATASFDLFWVVGFIQPTSAVSAGGTVNVVQSGLLTLLSGDTAFGASDPGKAIFLQSGGTNSSTTPPTTAGQASAKVGIVTSTSTFLAQIGAPYVN